mgnify:CR=1 FL=1
MKFALAAIVFVASITPSLSTAETLTLKEMTEDALRRTVELSDQIRSADARARGELGTAEITATPETPGSERSTPAAGNSADNR